MTTTTLNVRTYPGTHARIIASTDGMDRADWLKHRRGGIGGSDIAAILGENPWRSPIDVWLEKTGRVEDQDPTERMVWGTRAEDMIAGGYAADYVKVVRRVNAILCHKDHPHHRANLDRLIIDPTRGNGVLEVKNVGAWGEKAWADDNVPPHYMLQLQWYLHVTGLSWGVFAALIGGNKLIVRETQYDPELAAIMVQAAADFWQCVTDDTMPPAVSGDSEAVASIYPESNGDTTLLSVDASALVRQYIECKEAIATLEQSLDGIKARIQQEMGSAEIGLADGYRVSWKSQTRATIDTKRLKAERSDIADEYSRETTTRTFNIKQDTSK